MRTILSSFLIKFFLIILSIVFIIFLFNYVVNFSGNKISKISEDFSSNQVVNQFNSYINKLEGTNKLQIASIKSRDIFSKKDSKSILWNLISLPDVVVEVNAPVEYNYLIDLKKEWNFSFQKKDTSIIVKAPVIEYNKPAIDVSKMEIIVRKGSILRNVDEIKDQLRKELSAKLIHSAENKIPIIRETARIEIENFLRSWFLHSYFKNSDFKPGKIIVKFEDEINNNYVIEKENIQMLQNVE